MTIPNELKILIESVFDGAEAQTTIDAIAQGELDKAVIDAQFQLNMAAGTVLDLHQRNAGDEATQASMTALNARYRLYKYFQLAQAALARGDDLKTALAWALETFDSDTLNTWSDPDEA